MAETFFILLAGGIMLAAAVCDPRAVTLNWLRLCGILALVMAGLSAYFLSRADAATRAQMIAIGAAASVICGQLGFVQVAMRQAQRMFAAAAFVAAVASAVLMLNRSAWSALAGAGIAAMCGIALMDMLLGHAYLTASKMTIAPFRRLNATLAGALAYRAALCGVATALMSREIWLHDGLFILTRWGVGLIVPAVFVYMAHDCIKRRSTQSATGILYVAGVLIFIGELVGLYLVRATGLPF
jgi:uncharacterized membrane protein HdeD (DUF308 family)